MKHGRLAVPALVLLELALCALMAWTVQASGMTLAGLAETPWTEPSVMAQAPEEQRIQVDDPATLSVDNPFGMVRTTPGPSGEITIQANKVVWGASSAAAQAALAALELKATKDGNSVRLATTLSFPTRFSFAAVRPQVDLTITVPPSTSVRADNGDISADRFRGEIRTTGLIP